MGPGRVWAHRALNRLPIIYPGMHRRPTLMALGQAIFRQSPVILTGAILRTTRLHFKTTESSARLIQEPLIIQVG